MLGKKRQVIIVLDCQTLNASSKIHICERYAWIYLSSLTNATTACCVRNSFRTVPSQAELCKATACGVLWRLFIWKCSEALQLRIILEIRRYCCQGLGHMVPGKRKVNHFAAICTHGVARCLTRMQQLFLMTFLTEMLYCTLQSPFIGVTESQETPILYSRYTDVSELLLVR